MFFNAFVILCFLIAHTFNPPLASSSRLSFSTTASSTCRHVRASDPYQAAISAAFDIEWITGADADPVLTNAHRSWVRFGAFFSTTVALFRADANYT